MNPAVRARYHGHYWPAACLVKGWKKSDANRRRAVTAECMRLVRGPQTDSTTDPRFGDDEITALFCYLDFLAHPGDLEKSQRWLDCQQDYRMFNRARQADYLERWTYGSKGAGKLRRNRFGGAASAQGEAHETFDPSGIRKRHMTVANRAKRHGYRERPWAPGTLAFVAVVGGKVVTSAPESRQAVSPAGDDQDNPF